MRNRAIALLLTAAIICAIPAALQAQLPPPPLTQYTQNFDGLDRRDTSALANDGWLVFGNVFSPDGSTYLYGYGAFVAPNDSLAFCQVDTLQGGVEQGTQQLSVFSDYNNQDQGHAIGNLVESNVYQEQTVGAENVGQTWVFEFQAKRGNIELASTAAAFIKTLDPSAGYALTNFITEDMTSIPETWQGYSISITIDASLENQLLQIGFLNVATNFEGSGIFYDNLLFRRDSSTNTPSSSAFSGATLRQNYPNPFNPITRINFTLERSGRVELVVYDLAGRSIATLQNGELASGDHFVVWDGRTDTGIAVASGRYSYVLKTPMGQLSRSMVLLK